MARVRREGTSVEMAVRSKLHRAGFRYSLHKRGLPGKPDIVLSKYKTVVFVHGCFWHGHNCRRGRRPRTNRVYWDAKLDRNIARDRKNIEEIQSLGWRACVIWECRWETDVDGLIVDLQTNCSPLRV